VVRPSYLIIERRFDIGRPEITNSTNEEKPGALLSLVMEIMQR
jgi:hypothetical protein